MGIQTREINRRHQYDEGLQRARLDVIYIPSNDVASRR